MDYQENYEKLAHEIVMLAFEDWKVARHQVRLLRRQRTVHEKENYQNAMALYEEVEEFFRSDWFTTLTGMDGKAILKRMQKEL